jgi:uncharacterized protein YhhL (DUF1145 family)
MRVENVGHSPIPTFAWLTTSLLDAMVSALVIGIATAVGTLVGNLTLFFLIGTMAKRQERKQLEELRRLQQGYLEMAQRERERLENYAKMEG